MLAEGRGCRTQVFLKRQGFSAPDSSRFCAPSPMSMTCGLGALVLLYFGDDRVTPLHTYKMF